MIYESLFDKESLQKNEKLEIKMYRGLLRQYVKINLDPKNPLNLAK